MLDFSSRKKKKKYFDLALHDGTRLSLPTPTMEMQDTIIATVGGGDNKVSRGELTKLLRGVLEANVQGVKLTDEQVQAFDLHDMYELLNNYTDYVQGVLGDPNSKSPTTRGAKKTKHTKYRPLGRK